MPHDVTLIATIAVGFAFAFIFGFIANRFGLPPLVGYLVAGIAVGPFTPGFDADSGLAGQLAEIGVMLLMFGVGLHFSITDLMAVRRIAIPGAILQILFATALGAMMTMMWGWSLGAGIIFGLSISVASTVVLLKAMEERNAVSTSNGRIAVGWLIVEDLAMVLALVLLPTFAKLMGADLGETSHAATDENIFAAVGITLLKVVAFIAIALVVGPRVLPVILRQVARTGSRELFTLSVLAVAIGIAFGSSMLFGISPALGAFFAGMVLNESDLSHKAAANSLPLQDAFAVLFFVSVGMLFDPSVLLHEPLMVGAVVLLIIVGKFILASIIVLALGYPLSTALIVSASLAQIGEFSFILGRLGVEYKLVSEEGLNLILAGALLSITLNPLVFKIVDIAIRRIQKNPKWKARFEESRSKHFKILEGELHAAQERAKKKAAAHKTFTPEELAARFPMFSPLTSEQREVLVLHFQMKESQPGERVIRAGDKADAVYFISSGEVEVSVSGRRIASLKAGDFFGEMALLNNKPRSADVTALDYSKFATLSRHDFQQFMRRYPEIREQIATLAAQRGQMNTEALSHEHEKSLDAEKK